MIGSPSLSRQLVQVKSKRALKAILAKCTHLQALQPLLREAPVKVKEGLRVSWPH
jgi:nitrite reductase/ring-hydroxylating ferredoxin subunit